MWLNIILLIVIIFLVIRSYKQESRIYNIEQTLQKLVERKVDSPIVTSKEAPVNIPEPTLIAPPPSHIPDRLKTAPPELPQEESMWKSIYNMPFIRKISKFLLTGNFATKVGILILIVGIGFFLKDITPHFIIPVSLRLLIIALIGIITITLGVIWHTRANNYGYILQGGGFAILYATIIFGYNQYHLIAYLPALLILITVAIISVSMALLQDSKELIIFAQIGGFMLPLMISSANGSIYNLFAYYAVLNMIIAIIAWFKNWRELNVIGFTATFIIATIFGVLKYNPNQYLYHQLYLAYFIVLYLVITIIFAHKEDIYGINKLNGTLLFGVPIMGFSLQMGITSNYHYGSSISSAVFASLYFLLSLLLLKINKGKYQLLIQSFRNLSAIFFTLALVLIGKLHITESLFAIEGSLLLWLFNKTYNKNHYWIGLALLAISNLFALGIMFISYDNLSTTSDDFIVNILIGVATYVAAFSMKNHSSVLHKYNKSALSLFSATAIIFFSLVNYFAPNIFFMHIALFTSYSILWYVAYKARWLYGQRTALLFMLLSSITCIFLAWNNYPYQIYIPFASLLLITLNYGILKYAAADSQLYSLTQINNIILRHIIILELAIIWLNIASNYSISNEWQAFGASIILLISILVYISKVEINQIFIKPSEVNLNLWIITPLIVGVYLTTLIYNLTFIEYNNLRYYIPLFNPTDIIMAFNFTVMWYAYKKECLCEFNGIKIPKMLGLWFMVWITWLSLRSVHSIVNIDYNLDIFSSNITQTTLSIIWSIIGLGLTIVASKLSERQHWITGMSLLGLVIIKMIVIDMSSINGFTRVVSFIGVGIILLLIGYFAPVPPKNNSDKTD